MDLFAPFLIDSSDIIDRTRVDSLLREHDEVEQKHFKLWLASTTILRRVLHSAAINNSMLTEKEIRRQVSVYVHNESFSQAMTILKNEHYCIISGIPGIGKTTLANLLALYHLNEGYRFIAIDGSIQEAYLQLDPGKPQFFYYDDFLGTTALSSRASDKSLLRFIEHMRTSNNKRLVLTTREYILNQAQSESEMLSRQVFAKCIVRQEDYTKLIRARILYNHLFFSGIGRAQIVEFCDGKKYRDVISHKNYSPRIVQWVTSASGEAALKKSNLSSLIKGVLDNPTLIWQHAFQNDISDRGRIALVVLALFRGAMTYEDLKAVVYNWLPKRVDSVNEDVLFRKAIKELDNAFVNIMSSYAGVVVSFHDPSVSDFMYSYISEHTMALLPSIWNDCPFCDLFDGILSTAASHRADQNAGVTEFVSRNGESILLSMLESSGKPSGHVIVYTEGLAARTATNTIRRLNSTIYYFRTLDLDLLEKHRDRLVAMATDMLEVMPSVSEESVTLMGHLTDICDSELNITAAVLAFKEALGNTTDFSVLSELVTRPDVLDLLGESGLEVISDCFMEATRDEEIDEDKDIDVLELETQQIEEVAKIINVSLPSYYHRAQERIEELRLDRKEDVVVEDSMRKDFTEDSLEGPVEERLIDEMFASLAGDT